jgi:hypothetical protein
MPDVRLFDKCLPSCKQKLRFVVVLWGHSSARAAEALDCPVLSFEDVTASGGNHTGAGAA